MECGRARDRRKEGAERIVGMQRLKEYRLFDLGP